MTMIEPGEETPDLKADFIGAMGRVVSSVSVVTTDGPAGRFGLTVSAMSSVAADPPHLLVCINERTPTVDGVRANGVFCVNVLRRDQVDVARCFAGRPVSGPAYDFDSIGWSPGVTGSPQFDLAVASFDCRLIDAKLAATHWILIGEVVSARNRPGEPLLYGRRQFARPEFIEP